MTTEEIFERVKQIISEETCVPVDQIQWDSNIADLEGWNRQKNWCNRD
ncbi:MAG: hypothetical protein ABIV13_01440 [Fimbriimonadales bacterium]